MLLKLATLLTAAFLMVGCSTPCLHPIATKESTMTDAGLVGKWVESKDADATYIIAAADNDTYTLESIPNDTKKKRQNYAFTLFHLADNRFIDLTISPKDREDLGEKYGSLIVPLHVFMKVDHNGDSLKVSFVNEDWLKSGLKDGTHKLRHETVEEDTDGFLITASTAELEQFLIRNAGNGKAWDKPMLLERVVGETPAAKPDKK